MYRLPSYLASTVFAIAALTAGSTALANDDDHDRDHGLQQQLNALKAQVASLQATVSTLQTQLTNAKSVLALAPFVSVDPNSQIGVSGPNITFKGANIHIVSGSGATNDNGNPTGLGNLIIGYDEKPLDVFGIGPNLNPGDRGGSHNLVIGRGNRFTKAAFGGLVAGEVNIISNEGTSVLSGSFSSASGMEASVVGGNGDNTASGPGSVALGGHGNTASGRGSVALGGTTNTASGGLSNVLGGLQNTASGDIAVVLGGTNVQDLRTVTLEGACRSWQYLAS